MKSEEKKKIIALAMQEYIDTPVKLRSVAKTSDKYGINRKTLVRYLHEQGVETPNNAGGYNINENVFDNIDTEEKAYWLGFLYADGYVSYKNYAIGLELALKDIDHLKRFKDFLGWDGELKIREEHNFGTKDKHGKTGEVLYRARLIVNNKHMHAALIEKGCKPNKSLILTFPPKEIFSDERLIIPFIRGYFDGDGTLGLYRHSAKNPNMEESLMLVGTHDFLTEVQKYLGPGYLMQKRNCNEATYRLGYSTKKAYNAAKILYTNSSIHLDRKYDIFINQYAAKKLGKIGEPCDGNTEVKNG